LKESSKSCERLDDFISNLLKSSRAGSGETHFDLRRTSLQQTVDDVVKFLRPLLEQHELQVEVSLDSNALFALVDASPIEQVLTNLLGNAIKYTKPGSAVLVESRPLRRAGSDFVEVSVLDEGPGIAVEDQQRIFDPYVRATDERRASGLGLGLAICRRIVEAHRGGIAVTNREAGGSRFSFTLPAAKQAEVEI
jgi:signal transduction histidine kinase